MKRILTSVLLALSSLLLTMSAWSAEKTQAFDCVRFAANGNDIIVDSSCLLGALRNGADPNWVDRRYKRAKSTLFHFVELLSLSRDPHVGTVGVQAFKTLIAAGAKLQPVDGAILFFPISSGKTDIVALLLDIGADATAWPSYEIGTTLSPVETAAKEGHQAIVELLVEHGATRPNERHALQLRFVTAAKWGTADLLGDLLKKGATVNGQTPNGEVALINAIEGDVSLPGCKGYQKIHYLLDAGADVNMNGKGMFGTAPPLHHAVLYTSFLYKRKDDTRCAEMILSELIDRGARVSSFDSSGRTPLHIAAEYDHLFAARLLLKAGAKVMPRDKTGKTPLDYAESGEMIKLLKSHGATER